MPDVHSFNYGRNATEIGPTYNSAYIKFHDLQRSIPMAPSSLVITATIHNITVSDHILITVDFDNFPQILHLMIK